MSDAPQSPAPPVRPCPVCGATEFEDGTVRGQGMRWVASSVSGLKRVFGLGWGMRARICVACRNVQLFAE